MAEVRLLSDMDAQAWDDFVIQAPNASVYHLWAWRQLLGTALGHRPYYLGVGRPLRAVLPLIHVHPPGLRGSLVSLPFVNYGGVLGEDSGDVQALLEEAARLAGRLAGGRIELRHDRPIHSSWPARMHRVSLKLELPERVELLSRSLGSKLRSQLKKADSHGLQLSSGGREHLDAFYAVFAENMRDLGSPVWSRAFFARILQAFPGRCRIYRVDYAGQPVAAGFTLRFRQTVEIPWASSLRRFNSYSPNMRMYWEILSDAVREGYQCFDFGRSAPDAGTYRFKTQWGAKPVPLYWHTLPEVSAEQGEHEARQKLVALWSQLPLWAASLLGPVIRKQLPQ